MNDIDFTVAVIVAVSGIAGVAAGGIIQMVTAWGIRRNDERREYRRLAIEAALTNWRHQNELKVDILKNGGRGNIQFGPPDGFISHMLRIMHIASDMSLSPEEAANRITALRRGERRQGKEQTGDGNEGHTRPRQDS